MHIYTHIYMHEIHLNQPRYLMYVMCVWTYVYHIYIWTYINIYTYIYTYMYICTRSIWISPGTWCMWCVYGYLYICISYIYIYIYTHIYNLCICTRCAFYTARSPGSWCMSCVCVCVFIHMCIYHIQTGIRTKSFFFFFLKRTQPRYRVAKTHRIP